MEKQSTQVAGNKKKKWLVRSAIIVVGVLVLLNIAGGTYFFIYSIVNKKISGMEIPLDEGIKPSGKTAAVYTDWYAAQPFEEMRITTQDGIELVGRYIKANQPSQKLAVLVHGYMMEGAIMAAYGKYYQEDGFNLFIADNRGHGNSGGTYVGMGWLDRKDYLEWLNVLIPKTGEDAEIVIHGISMGGATVMYLSGEKLPAQVKCLIEDCGYTSVWDEFRYQGEKLTGFLTLPFLTVSSIESKLFAGYGYREASAVKQVAKSTTPMFFIHGAEDSFTPTRMVHKVYEATACEKELWVVPGAEHGKAFDIDPDTYFQKVRAFYKKYITE